MTAFQLELFPAPPPKPQAPTWPIPDWGVLVNETRIFATGMGADWWLLFSSRYESTPRMTLLIMMPQGGQWHVACDSKEDAQDLAEHMVSFGGVPKSAVEVKQLPKCKRWSA